MRRFRFAWLAAAAVAVACFAQLLAYEDARAGEVVHTTQTYQTYGNTAIADCTFAAAADWVQVTQNRVPNETEVIRAFYRAGGDPEWGMTVGAFSWYWQHRGIAGTRRHLRHLRFADGSFEWTALEVLHHAAVLADVDDFGTRHMLAVVGYRWVGSVRELETITWGEARWFSWEEWVSWHPRVFRVVHA